MRFDRSVRIVHCDCQERAALCTMVNAFSSEMGKKLLRSLDRGKRGWDDPSWEREEAIAQLLEHVKKGDMVDVANFAMFIWNMEACGAGIRGCKGGPHCSYDHK